MTERERLGSEPMTDEPDNKAGKADKARLKSWDWTVGRKNEMEDACGTDCGTKCKKPHDAAL
jgi:hypothetical protein